MPAARQRCRRGRSNTRTHVVQERPATLTTWCAFRFGASSPGVARVLAYEAAARTRHPLTRDWRLSGRWGRSETRWSGTLSGTGGPRRREPAVSPSGHPFAPLPTVTRILWAGAETTDTPA